MFVWSRKSNISNVSSVDQKRKADKHSFSLSLEVRQNLFNLLWQVTECRFLFILFSLATAAQSRPFAFEMGKHDFRVIFNTKLTEKHRGNRHEINEKKNRRVLFIIIIKFWNLKRIQIADVIIWPLTLSEWVYGL